MPFSVWDYLRERVRDAFLAGIQDALDIAETGDDAPAQQASADRLVGRLAGANPRQLIASVPQPASGTQPEAAPQVAAGPQATAGPHGGSGPQTKAGVSPRPGSQPASATAVVRDRPGAKEPSPDPLEEEFEERFRRVEENRPQNGRLNDPNGSQVPDIPRRKRGRPRKDNRS